MVWPSERAVLRRARWCAARTLRATPDYTRNAYGTRHILRNKANFGTVRRVANRRCEKELWRIVPALEPEKTKPICAAFGRKENRFSRKDAEIARGSRGTEVPPVFALLASWRETQSGRCVIRTLRKSAEQTQFADGPNDS